jgi:uncharacterized protein (TIGR04222 family)
LSPAGDAGSSGATNVWLTASYLLLLAATGGVVVRNRHRITGEALMTADTVSIDDLSRCEIALLNGGAKHAALVATLDLAASEQLPELEELVAGRGSQVDTLTAYLESVAPAILAMPRPSRSLSALDPLSWRVLTACASSSTTGEVRAKVLDSDEMEAMHQRLVALGLLLDADQVGRLRRLWPWLIPPPLIGAACLVAGIVGHQPVNSLSALLFLNLIGLLPALAFLHPRRTRAGARLLSTTTAPASPIGGVGAAVAAAFDKPTDVATTYPVLATLYQLPDGSEAG